MMMRKRLFYWLVSFYIFVVQVVIVAHLWQDSRLYIVAGINFLVLLFFSFLFSLIHRSSDSHRGLDKKKSVVKTRWTSHNSHWLWSHVYYFFQHYLFVIVLVLLPVMMAVDSVLGKSLFSIWWLLGIWGVLFIVLLKALIHKKIFFIKRQFSPRAILFVLSLFFVFVSFAWMKNGGVELRLAFLISVLLSFLLFLLAVKIFRARRMQRLWSFWSVRLYSLALLFTLIVFVLWGYFDLLGKEKYDKEQSWIYSRWTQLENIVKDTWLSSSSSRVKTTFSDVISWDNLSSEFAHSSGQILDLQIEDTVAPMTGWNSSTVVLEPRGTVLRNAENYTDTDPLIYRDVLVYLLEDNNIALDKDSYNISFAHLSKTDVDYLYFKTAYYKKLIWSALKPYAKVKCDNYLVMKWILEWRDVSKYSWDIFQKYYDKAKDSWVLHACERGQYLLKWNL